MNFKRSFRPVVELKPGDMCEWKKHFRNVLREVIGYLESQAARHPVERFTWVHVDTIAARCTQFSKGKKPYSKTAIEKALAYLEELGIIVRVRQMEWKGRTVHGFLIAPHGHACKPVDKQCRFWCGGLNDLGFDRPGVKIDRVEFHGSACGCEECTAAQQRHAELKSKRTSKP